MATISISVSAATDVNALIDNAGGGFGSTNRGWFEGTMLMPHDSYGFQSGANSSAFVAEGSLTYNPIPGFSNSHVLQGDLDSIDIGTGLNNGTGTGYAGSNTLATAPLSISGLGITGSTGSGGLANTIVFGLANGSESALNNYLFNTSSNNIVFTGSAGNDSITGGLGADQFTGNGGTDTFVFTSGAHANGDEVFGFSGDVIDLTALSLNGGFTGTTADFDAVWYDDTSGDTVIYGDLDSDSIADFSLTLDNYTSGLTGSNFLV
jgi:serralysin